MSELSIRADGTFERRNYSPGNNKLIGTWEVRWNSLPPTLVLNCKTSDYSGLVGKREYKLTQLDDETLTYFENGYEQRYTRIKAPEKSQEQELWALQGTWVPLQYEEGGKKAEGAISTRHVIKGDKLTVQVNGETVAEGKVVLDPTKNPRHLDFHLNTGQTHLMIYVRVGDHVIYCGNRDGKNRPTEFVSGTAKGGEYLIAWKIEK